tara:strand:- start:4220 stop:4657 length:438 start_codon:yes stop_codon:yes gene_type:complete
MNYNRTLYTVEGLKKYAPRFRKVVRAIVAEDKNVVGLISTGSSGACIATAILLGNGLELDHIHVKVRSSHDTKIKGGKWQYPRGNYIFVDDFMDTGGSVLRCVRELKRKKHIDVTPPVIKYIVCTASEQCYLDKRIQKNFKIKYV